jgi:hypothetical protein
MKIAPAKGNENVGLWGLLAIIAVAFLLIFATVPVLALRGGVPIDAYYSTNGFSGTVTPKTPTGWQVNSTTVYHFTSVGDLYAVKKVYVPIFHPETKNYTMYYEVSIVYPYSLAPGGGDIAGWTRSSNIDAQLGPFLGYLTTYTAATATMIAFQGVSHLLFLNGTSFDEYYVGLGFERTFKNTNVNADSSQFLMDISALWLPAINSDVSYSTFTGFLSTIYSDAVAIETFVLIVSSIAIIGWIAYRASSLDDTLDRFLSIASTQTEENWSHLSSLIKRPHHSGTGQELVSAVGVATHEDNERLASSLRELEQRRLISRSLIEKGADIISVWRTVV